MKKGLFAFVLTIMGLLSAEAFSQEFDEKPAVPITVKYLGTRTTQQINQKTLIPNELARDVSSSSDTPHRSSVKIGLNFTATSFSKAPDVEVIPPNLNGWVGEEQYILMCYQHLRSFNKKTGKPDGVLDSNAGSFFGEAVDDVRIDYDRFGKRWLLSGETYVNNNVQNLLIAVSEDSVITESTKWNLFLILGQVIVPQTTDSFNLDYQQLAVDKYAVYISLDTFDNVSGNFLGTSTIVIQKSSLYENNPIVNVFTGLQPESDPNLGEFTPPADNFDKDAKFGYLIHASSFGYPSGNTYYKLYLYRIVKPGSDHPTIEGPFSINVPAYSEPANAPHKGNLYGANGFLQIGVFGALEAPHVRDGQLFACHPIQVNSSGVGTPNGDRVGVRWYQLDLSGDKSGKSRGDEKANTVPALVQSGTLYDSDPLTSTPRFFYIPSIMTNKNQELVIEGTVSGENEYTNVFIASRKKTDSKGKIGRPLLVTKNTSNAYNFGPLLDPSNGGIGQRWGDESSLSPDPVNDLDIWATGEWAAVQNGWGIQVIQVKPSSKSNGCRK